MSQQLTTEQIREIWAHAEDIVAAWLIESTPYERHRQVHACLDEDGELYIESGLVPMWLMREAVAVYTRWEAEQSPDGHGGRRENMTTARPVKPEGTSQ